MVNTYTSKESIQFLRIAGSSYLSLHCSDMKWRLPESILDIDGALHILCDKCRHLAIPTEIPVKPDCL